MDLNIINTVIISEVPESTLLLKKALAQSNYNIIFDSHSLKDLLQTADLVSPELIIVILQEAHLDMFTHLKIITEQFSLPVVIFSDDDRDDVIEHAIASDVSAYVMDGMDEHRIIPILKMAQARFKQQASMQQEIESLRTDLADRKQIDKAKGIIMSQRQCSEDEAYKLLRTSAMNQNIRLAELAKNIISTAALLA